MIIYSYKALTNENVIVSGREQAQDIDQLKVLLKQKSLTLISARKKTLFTLSAAQAGRLIQKALRVRRHTYRIFIQDLSLFLQAGRNIRESLNIIQNSARSFVLKKVIKTIIYKLDNGYSISDAFSGFPFIFDKIFLARLNNASMNTKLKDIFVNIQKDSTESHFFLLESVTKIIPHIALVIFSLFMWGLFSVTLLPEFQWAYAYSRTPLPDLVDTSIKIITFIQKNWETITTMVTAGLIAIRLIYFIKPIKFALNLVTAFLPGLSSLTYNNNIEKFYSTLSLGLSSKVNLLPSFHAAIASLSNSYYRYLANKVYTDINQGDSLKSALQRRYFLKKTEVNVISVAENTNLSHAIDILSKQFKLRSRSSNIIAIEVIRFTLLTTAIILLLTLLEVIDQALIPLIPSLV